MSDTDFWSDRLHWCMLATGFPAASECQLKAIIPVLLGGRMLDPEILDDLYLGRALVGYLDEMAACGVATASAHTATMKTLRLRNTAGHAEVVRSQAQRRKKNQA